MSCLLATAYGLPASTLTGALAPFDALPPERINGAKHHGAHRLRPHHGRCAARRAPRWVPGQGHGDLASTGNCRGRMPRKASCRVKSGLSRSKRLSSLTTAVAIACAAAEAHRTPWQAVINSVRSSLQDIWQGLPVEEQARFLRHVRPLWDAHRHRLPLEVHGRLQAEFNEGRAVLLRGQVTKVERDGEGFRLTLRRRGSKRSGDADGRPCLRLHRSPARSRLAPDREPGEPGRWQASMPIASGSPCSRTARPWAEAARRRLGCSRLGRSAKGRSGRSPPCPRSCANAMQRHKASRRLRAPRCARWS